MKKILALFLALLMLCSVALVSCNKDKEEETGDSSEDIWSNPTGDSSSSEDASGDSSDDDNASSSSSFTPASGTVYFLYSFKVFKNAKSTSGYVGDVAYASSAELIEKNSKWSKIRFTDDGITLEGYVYNITYTTNQNDVTLVKYDTPILGKISGVAASQKGANVRTTPWNCGSFTKDEIDTAVMDKYANCNIVNGVGEKYYVKNDTKLEITGAIKDATGNVVWYFAKYTVIGNDNTTSYTGEGFIHHSCVTPDGVTSTTPPAATDSNTINPV